jgi:hypothetical protein
MFSKAYPIILALPFLVESFIPIQASPSVISNECNLVLVEIQQRIERVNATNIVRTRNNKNEYLDYPKGRYQSYSIVMDGYGADAVLNSPVFLLDISKRIISACSSIGFVDIGLDKSDVGTKIGIMKNGKVDEFKCITKPTPYYPNWGYQRCL